MFVIFVVNMKTQTFFPTVVRNCIENSIKQHQSTCQFSKCLNQMWQFQWRTLIKETNCWCYVGGNQTWDNMRSMPRKPKPGGNGRRNNVCRGALDRTCEWSYQQMTWQWVLPTSLCRHRNAKPKQVRNQLGTTVGAKSFLRGAQIF